MAISVPAPSLLGGFAISVIASAVKGLYGMAIDVGEYIDKHIAEMKSSDNPTVSRTGRVLELAKLGFGLSYLSSVTIIAVGQYLLGNTLAAITTVATAATLSNPIAMTCAAIGAILYGWNALSDKEKSDILERLSSGLGIGIELIKSIVGFVIEKTKETLDAKVVKELKAFVAEKAALFGRSLSDVTHLTVDVISDTGAVVLSHTSTAIAGTRRVAGRTSDKVGEALTDLAKVAGDTFDHTVDSASEATRKVIEGSRKLVQRTRDDKPAK